MRHFRYSFVITILCVGLAFLWGSSSAEGGVAAVTLVLLLGVMEVSLSFDNAVVMPLFSRKWMPGGGRSS